MKMRRMNLLLITLLFVALSTFAFGDTTVFSETFTEANSSYASTVQIGTTALTANVSGVDFGCRVNGNLLEVSNDASTTANVQGWGLAYNTSAPSSPYTTTLSSNTGAVTWSFNMRQIRPDPAGFGISSYGVAFILAGSSTSANTTGTGYAVALGQSGGTDPIRLIKYNNGLQGTLTNIITSNTTGLTDFGADYLSIKVTYTPSTNTWELFLRNDGTTAFADPLSGSLTTQGTAIDNTYTGAALAKLGAYWQGSTGATQFASFDNIVVSIAGGSSLATEPTSRPTSLQFGTVLDTSFNVSFTAASPTVDGYIAIRKTGSAPTTDPADGTAYTAGTTLGDGTVVFSGSGVSFSQSGLTASTTYYYKVYPFNGSATTTNYLITTPLSSSQATTAGATPTITLSTATLTGFNYTVGSGPSTTQTFTVGGTSLSADISIAASTDYEISKSIASGYTTPLTFTQSGGTVTTTTVYVRLKAGLSTANYNSEVLTASSTGASNQTVTCSGSVSAVSVPSAPVATAATDVTSSSFTSNWNSASGATSYRLDVYTGSAGGGTISELFISEYVEGTSNNKAIEIYNGTGATVDLSAYSLKKQTNGAGAFVNELVLSGTLVNNDVYITANTSANATILALADNTNNTVTAFNGNDAVALYKNGVQIDVVGIVDQVTPDWGANVTLVRKGTITAPTVTYSASDWNSNAVDTFSYLGSHSLSREITYVSGYQDLNVGNVYTYPVSGLSASTQYHYVVRGVNDGGASANSNAIDATTSAGTSLATEPTAQPTSIVFGSVASTTMTVSYTAASPAVDGYIAVRKTGSAPTTDPADGTAYTAGTTLGDGTVVFSGSAVTFSQSSLTASTTYYYKIYSYNGSGVTTNYLTTTPLAGNQATTATDPFGGYYTSVAGLTGSALKAGLHTIIKTTHTTQFSYSDLETQLKVTDEDPNNSSNVLEMYTGWSVPKSAYGGGVTDWNKEHIWSKSHGFSDSAPAGSDLHHLRPSDATVNSAKSNRDFDEGSSPYTDASPYGSYSGVTGCYTSTDIWEPRDVEKGDVARMIFYMAVRYESDDPYDLEMVDYVNSSPSGEPLYGKKSTLLAWAAADPPDAWEALRNNRIQSLQGNRNPFIDHPEWVSSIFGGGPSVPTVTTTLITSITTITASSGGTVTNDGGATVSSRGVCWNTTGTPVITDSHTTDSSGTGTYTSSLASLTANTLYYVRAYATNSIGTAYGDPVTFTTLKVEPAAHVTSFAAGTTTSASIPLTWTDAANTDTYLIKGSSSSFAAITAPSDGTAEADGALVHNVAQGLQTYTFTGLTASTTYYFKIYPYTNTGTSVNYKTDGSVPQVSAATQAIVPTIVVTPATMTFSSNVGVASAAQTAAVASSDLTGVISVSSAGPFTFSLTAGGTYSNPLELVTNYTGNVYIKFTPPAAQTYTDVINFVSGTASDTIVPSATGTTVTPSLLFVENFDYTPATLLTANGWTNHSGTSNYIPVSSTGLTYSGYPSVGGSASMLTSGEDVHRLFTEQTSGTIYASLLINVSSSQTTGDYLFHFGTDPWSTTLPGRLFVKKDASTTNFALGITRGAAVASAVFTSYTYVPNTTYLVVLKYSFVDGTLNDEVKLFVNPTVPGSEPTADLTISTGDTTTDPTGIAGVGLRQGSSTAAPAALIDGIRIANDWSLLFPSGTPEINVTSSFTTFSTVAGNPSASQSYTVSGNNLIGNIGVQAPTGFELSTTDADPWTSSLSLAPGYRGTVYVRLNHATPNTYSGNIVHTSQNATTVNRAVTGTTSAPAGVITVVQSLTQFSTLTGTPSAIQSYTLTGTDLTGLSLDVASATSAGATFQIRTAEGDGVWHTDLSLLPTYDGLIEVRFNPTVAGTYSGTLTHYSDGVVDNVVNVSGVANDPTPVLSVLPATMAFTTNSGTTSAAQSCTVTSANLSNPIDIASTGLYTFSSTQTGTYSNPLQVASTYNGSIWIKFSPASIGTVYNTITFTSGAKADTISTTGNGIDPNTTVATDLFISEYVEGTSYNKAIEIFNGTGASVDLSTYSLMKQTNGAGAFGSELVLSGTLANNDVYVIVSNAAGGTNLVGQPYVDLDTNSQAVNFNGNDAVALYHNGIQTDVVGIVGQVTPSWGADSTFVRNSNIVSPTTVYNRLTDWTAYGVGTYSYLGSHSFLPGLTSAVAPTIIPTAGLQSAPIMVSMSSSTPGAQIRYTTNGSDPIETSALYSESFSVSTTTTVKARTYASGYAPSSISSAAYIYPTNVTNVAALRALTAGTGTYYKLTGEVVLTLKSAIRNSKYVQDATGAVLIDDLAGKITTSYNIGDGITGLVGTIAFYTGMLQFTPAADPGIASSTGNTITPEVVTLSALDTSYQAKLVKIQNVTFLGATGNFAAPAANYSVQDASGTGVCRDQYTDLDYVGTAVPTTPKTIVGVILQYTTGTPAVTVMQFVPRSLAEFTNGAAPDAPTNVTITVVGDDIHLSWDADANATSWTVYVSDVSSYTGFEVRGTTLTNSITLEGDALTYPYRYYYIQASN